MLFTGHFTRQRQPSFQVVKKVKFQSYLENSTVGPFILKILKASALVACVRADHTHLCDVVVFVRPLQKRVGEPQSRDALKRTREEHVRRRRRRGSV